MGRDDIPQQHIDVYNLHGPNVFLALGYPYRHVIEVGLKAEKERQERLADEGSGLLLEICRSFDDRRPTLCSNIHDGPSPDLECTWIAEKKPKS